MDQALKQRLVGALVITALAAIFVPMFFEDSVDDSRREVSQNDLAIPAAPEQDFNEDNPIPQAPQQVLHEPVGEAESAPAVQEDSGDEAEISAADAPTAESAEAEQPELPAEDVPLLEEVPPEPPVAAPQREKASAPAAAKKPAPPVKQVKQQAPVAEPPAQVKQKTPAAASSPKAPELQRWVVQLGSFSKKDNADALVSKLRAQGFNAYGDSIEAAGKGTMYRVRIGPELDKKRAQATQKKLQQLDATSSIVVSE